jgi:hypothetical protein
VELINNGIVEVIKKFIDLFLRNAKPMNDFGIDETE